MKRTTLFIALILCVSAPVNAQFLKKLSKKIENAAEKAVERKVEQKTTKETEKAFDSTFNKKKKKKTTNDNGGRSISGFSKINPANSYSFNNKAIMHIKTGKEEMDADYYLSESDDFFGMTIKDKRVQDDFFMVYDVAREAVFTFMENNGQKMKMGLSFKTEDEDIDTPEFKIVETGKTKSILGYHCKEYKMTGENITAAIWVTKDVDIRFPNTFHSVKKKKSDNQLWMKDLDGWAMEMEMVDTSGKKPHTIIMNCLSIEKIDLKINSTNYKSIGGY